MKDLKAEKFSLLTVSLYAFAYDNDDQLIHLRDVIEFLNYESRNLLSKYNAATTSKEAQNVLEYARFLQGIIETMTSVSKFSSKEKKTPKECCILARRELLKFAGIPENNWDETIEFVKKTFNDVTIRNIMRNPLIIEEV